ncbi:MAG: hypothetical protein AAF581_13890 [Planctomycetota bacterium]
MRRSLTTILFALSLCMPTFGGQVLVYEVNSTGHFSEQAALALSHNVTTVTTSTTFLTAITNGTAWDLVMVEIADVSMSDDAALLIDSHVSLGGKAILSYARLDSGASDGVLLRSTFQIAAAADLPTTLAVQAVDPTAPIWSTPNLVAPPLPPFASVPWGDWGDSLTPTAAATAVASFPPSPAGVIGDAIVVGNGGNTICNGFVYDIYEPGQMGNLMRNQIAMLLPSAPLPSFVRGDVDSGGSINLQDAIAILNYLFLVPAPPTPPCLEAADIDAGTSINIADVIVLLTYLFQSGPPPAAPFPNCAPTATSINCNSFPACGFP